MIWVVAVTVMVLVGLNAPLAACALSLAVLNERIAVRHEFAWLGTPGSVVLALALLALQLLADLYFVPIIVKDRVYLNPQRTHNAYLHARIQSFLRPLTGAVLIASLPLPIPDWTAAVLGFTVATGVYWLSAWIREYVAMARGALVLLVIEALKNAILLMLAALLFWLPPLALLLLLVLLFQTSAWTMKLQREHLLHAQYGGQRAGEDS